MFQQMELGYYSQPTTLPLMCQVMTYPIQSRAAQSYPAMEQKGQLTLIVFNAVLEVAAVLIRVRGRIPQPQQWGYSELSQQSSLE